MNSRPFQVLNKLEPNAVLFHASCPDGWTAAWVAHRALRDADIVATLIPVTHGDDPPDLNGVDQVFIVDFSYPHNILLAMTAGGSRRVVVLDHHQSAIDDICGNHEDSAAVAERYSSPYETELDINRSGAGIAWDYFRPGVARPAIVDYVEDRDLWRWKLKDSKEINAFIKSQPYTLETWDVLSNTPLETLKQHGIGALAQVDNYCRAAASHAYMCRMADREFPIVNVTYEGCSDVANYILETTATDMAGYFFERGDGGWQYGFRSRNGVTVHDLAKIFGGGGHPQASGCVTQTIVHKRL